MAADRDINILVVDNHHAMRRILSNLLKQLGFRNVTEADEGGEAFEKMQQHPYDLVFSSWNMEPMNGLDFLKLIRADDALKLVPFIMVTSESKPENVMVAKEAGVSNYIVKPFNAETLKNKIASIFGQI